MNNPNKQETEQFHALQRQLTRLAGTTDHLYRRLGINGRDPKITEAVRRVSMQLEQLAKQVGDVMST